MQLQPPKLPPKLPSLVSGPPGPDPCSKALLSGPLLRGWSYSDGGDSPRLGSSDQLWGLVTFQIGEAAQGGPGEHSPAHRPPPQLNPARILGSMLGSSHVSLSD